MDQIQITAAILSDLLSPSEVRRLQFVHTKEEAEQQASDEDGLQGGQRWSPPTKSPSESPTLTPSVVPTMPPSYHPTPHGEPFVLNGVIWYDRNANGHRDTGVSMPDFGSDVEFDLGLGGVKVTLVQCNAETNREIASSSESYAASSLAATVSQGYNSKMEPMLSTGGGVYRLVNIKLDTSYSVRVEAPTGYLFTSGICNDDERGWKCEYTGRNTENEGTLRRNLPSDTSSAHSKDSNNTNKKNREFAMGITSGRSTECITVDRNGIPDKALNFGIMRIGDSKSADADVALVLDFDDAVASGRGRRGLKEMIRDAIELPPADNDPPTLRRYLLGETDKQAIGSVTAEVLASQLDKRLEQSQIVLDGVDPKDVILSADSQGTSKELAVALNIKGHYSPPPELDFEYIVNDSINSDTDQIRRELRDYNQNCRDQTAKVQSGSSMSDFNEVHSKQGANVVNRVDDGDSAVYRTTCAEGETLPVMFETSLKEISATKVSEIAFAPIIYMEEEALAAWATGPLAAVSGLIALLMGVFVFRRALGPRKVDRYRRLQKTGLVDVGDERRFGEMGGDVDDGSVDSAFYSSSDDEDYEYDGTKSKEKKMRAKLRGDNATKDKEKKMRAKLRAEAEKAKGGNGVSAKKFAKSAKKFSKSSKKILAIKTGSADDTDSVPSSGSGDKDVEKKQRSSKKKSSSGKELRASTSVKSSMRASNVSVAASVKPESLRSSTKSNKSENLRASTKSNKSDKKSSRRGRDRSDGGDNAKIVDAELKKSIV